MAPVNNNKDPLAMARKSLDFAAMAAAAPSSKDILFKAQTMVPLKPAKPWWKVSKWTILSVLACALVFAPWLPSSSSMALLKVRFEQNFDRPAAQELVLRFVKDMPDYAILGVEYGEDSSTTPPPGQLTLRVDAVNRSPHEVQDRINSVIEAYSATNQPYTINTHQVWVRDFNSPFMHLLYYIDGKSQPRSSEADPLAREILDNESVFAQGAKSRLLKLGSKLEKFNFLNSRSISGDLEYDFRMEAWPRPVGVSVEHYANLTDSEQEAIRATVSEFLRDANLADTGMMLTTTPQSWLPVIIHVLDDGGEIDHRLSAKAQAEMVQPTDEQLLAIDFDVDVPVLAALKAAMPGKEFLTEIGESHIGSAHYVVRARVTGERASVHPWVTQHGE